MYLAGAVKQHGRGLGGRRHVDSRQRALCGPHRSGPHTLQGRQSPSQAAQATSKQQHSVRQSLSQTCRYDTRHDRVGPGRAKRTNRAYQSSATPLAVCLLTPAWICQSHKHHTNQALCGHYPVIEEPSLSMVHCLWLHTRPLVSIGRAGRPNWGRGENLLQNKIPRGCEAVIPHTSASVTPPTTGKRGYERNGLNPMPGKDTTWRPWPLPRVLRPQQRRRQHDAVIGIA